MLFPHATRSLIHTGVADPEEKPKQRSSRHESIILVVTHCPHVTFPLDVGGDDLFASARAGDLVLVGIPA